MTKNQHINSHLNHKLAIILSLNFSLLFAFFGFIGYLFSEKSGNDFNINQLSIHNSIIHFFTSIFIIYLLFEYCFWAFRKKWELRKKSTIAFCGAIGLAILISPVFSKITFLLFQSVPVVSHNRLIVLNLIKDMVSATLLLTSPYIREKVFKC